jgi:hypothetical protein
MLFSLSHVRYPVLLVHRFACLCEHGCVLFHVHHAPKPAFRGHHGSLSCLAIVAALVFCCFPWCCSSQFVDSPPEIASIPHSFKLVTDGKELFLYSDSEEEHMAWRRRIREAVRLIRTTGDVTPASPAVIPAAGADGRPATVHEGEPAPAREDVTEEPSTYGFQSAMIGVPTGLLGCLIVG